MNEWELLQRIGSEYSRILAKDLTGIYVHGSIAFGCFRWACSDIDFLVVVERPLSLAQKEALIRVLLDLDSSAPPKGFEMSVLLRSACAPFAEPTPFELHYSNAHRANYRSNLSGACQALQGFDPDLGAHLTVVRKAGIVLCGLPIEQVFAPVPAASYVRSVWYDVKQAAEDIGSDPVYHVLNLCRALACVEEGLVLSKAQGGEWGMKRLPEHREVIKAALCAYREGMPAPQGEALVFFARTVLDIIRPNAVFLSAGIKND